MAYTPVNWQTGDTITADRLNRMDRGWGVDSAQLFSETVMMEDDGDGLYSAAIAYSQLIDADTITVTFDGTEYECHSVSEGEYGAPYNDGNPDFSKFPFTLYTSSDGAAIITQTAGEHTIAASTVSIEISSSFDSAVVLAGVFEVVSGTTTFQEARDAFKSGKRVCVVSSNSGKTLRSPVFLVNESTFEIKFISTSNSDTQIALSGLSASSADGVLG